MQAAWLVARRRPDLAAALERPDEHVDQARRREEKPKVKVQTEVEAALEVTEGCGA